MCAVWVWCVQCCEVHGLSALVCVDCCWLIVNWMDERIRCRSAVLLLFGLGMEIHTPVPVCGSGPRFAGCGSSPELVSADPVGDHLGDADRCGVVCLR